MEKRIVRKLKRKPTETILGIHGYNNSAMTARFFKCLERRPLDVIENSYSIFIDIQTEFQTR